MPIKFGSLDTKIYLGNDEVSKVYLGSNEVYSSGPDLSIPLCFTAVQAGSTVELTRIDWPPFGDTAYSRDGNTWTTFSPSNITGTNVITLTNVGDKVYFRGGVYGDFTEAKYLQFKMTGLISASGNINSMYSPINFASLTSLNYKCCFYKLFYGCSSLITAPLLPATTLSLACYGYMFYGCTSLTTTPELPATTLSLACYGYMFCGCTSLINLSPLLATNLAETCYQGMFRGCTSLTTPIKLPATTLAKRCYAYMFSSCTSLTTLPKLPVITLTNWCYSNMFNGCQSIKLSATQIGEYVNEYRIPYTGEGTDASDSLYDMFSYTGGTFTGTPTINTTYYTSNEVI